ncbi:hypothetical protein [Natronococcus wangiae]|uniref:hypothetical protein n=1 Tax=Natronococcus wangiae TaxID=3068275 RepID=UPI00273F66D0|nr:hypothetical protein [Natronococcus sp. AD5]
MTEWNPTGDRKTNREDGSETPAAGSANGAIKRGTVAAGASVVGSSALGNESAETTEESPDAGETGDPSTADAECPQPDQLVLVSLTDYRPGLAIRVIDRLPAPIVVQILRLPNDETVPVLTQPDEYTGYVVRSEFGDEQVHSTMLVFTRGALETDASYEFGTDTQVFSTRLNLFRVTARCVDSRNGEDGDAEDENGG